MSYMSINVAWFVNVPKGITAAHKSSWADSSCSTR